MKIGMNRFALLVALCAGLSGCASISDKVGGWLATDAPVIGVLDGRVLRGLANFRREREASVQLESRDEPRLSCFGPLSFTSTNEGVVSLSCSDGRAAVVHFRALSPLSGNGRSLPNDTVFALTYGLTPQKAAAFLGVGVDKLTPAPAPKATAPRSGGEN